ncbi:flagellar hook-associated protein FlgK [Oxalicibacterium flavum]|uniref:Flagellar hook-associated protein 1 n=1 Tax=Oxalicibacterium flavum TaxID=179467 RepID=A0A8J2XXN0_9BURK|nr:flagellar hook-associated protein FlgK [Oxalicibacterium flavum]GGC03718.1 flagellar hook-associated protein FlgK [Oxalicibacterium flavum]
MANILSIAKSGLAAAQIGMATTSHNIANQKTPGYSRQLVIQTSAGATNQGVGFIGNGVDVQTVQRVYNSFLATQAMSAQSSASQYSTYYAQISKINNLVADSSVGLSPVLQDFFAGLQDLVANPGTAASRQAMLSGAEALAARFRSLDSQLQGMRQGVNEEITAAVTNINAYAKQIAQLNEAIAKAQNGTGQPPNDLLDQRDLLVAELSKQTKVTIVQQESGYGVFIGNGQPLVVGPNVQELVVMPSTTDPGRLQVGYNASGTNILIPENSLTGGNLGGLFEYRSKTLDQIQNALGRIAIGLASTFNEQHKLGLDQNGDLGTDFFNVASPAVQAGAGNSPGSAIGAAITDAGALSTNDYRISFDGTNYRVTRLPDNVSVYNDDDFPADIIDGVTLTLDGPMAAGDEFMIRPTANGASNFNVLITDTKLIAAAAPVVTGATTGNAGSGTISTGTANAAYTPATLTPALTLTYDSATSTFSGFPNMDVDVTVNGVTTTIPAGDPVPYTAGATISFGGVEIQISGAPANGDTFTVGPNVNGSGDNRNMLLLGELQTKNVLQGGTANYNSAYSQIVSQVGNKTRELQVNSEADAALLLQIQTAQQSESGVNLDEEATNLLQYQQAYQAAARVMQAVSDMFDVLISLGR